ncbi:MAG: response regulator transcription factor [Terriglobales bacterium]
MAKLLIVEDDRTLASTVQDWLQEEKHTIDLVETGRDALDRLMHYDYELIVLDLGLPDIDGTTICKEMRNSGGNIPVLMLTGRADIKDKQKGFDVGADDYLTKPFDLRELSARIRSLLRRPAVFVAAVLNAGAIELDTKSQAVSVAGNAVQLLPQEYMLLEFLMRHPNELFSQEALLNRVWSSESDASIDNVRLHIARLRKKLESDGQPCGITTVHRQGYKLEV